MFCLKRKSSVSVMSTIFVKMSIFCHLPKISFPVRFGKVTRASGSPLLQTKLRIVVEKIGCRKLHDALATSNNIFLRLWFDVTSFICDAFRRWNWTVEKTMLIYVVIDVWHFCQQSKMNQLNFVARATRGVVTNVTRRRSVSWPRIKCWRRQSITVCRTTS